MTREQNSILWALLDTPEPHTAIGGKAANLQVLYAKGFKIPDTRIVTTNCLSRFLDANSLRNETIHYIREFTDLSEQKQQTAYSELCRKIRTAPWPEAQEQIMRSVVCDLLAQRRFGLAVRSSAVSEDSAHASFAGVFESYLGITNEDEVLNCIKDCWCSLWSPRAIRYATRMGINLAPDGMAVLLQQVLPAEKSGVLYTADPKTGNPFLFQLSMVDGLSIDLMSGSGAGSTVMLDWENGNIESLITTRQSKTIQATVDGLQETESSSDPGTPCPTELAVQLAELGRQIDGAFSCRMDIEWVLSNGQLWVVQARPLTALPTYFPLNLEVLQEDREWKPGNLVPIRAGLPSGLLTPFYSDISDVELWFRHHPEGMVLTGCQRLERDCDGFRFSSEIEPSKQFHDYFENVQETEAWFEKHEAAYRVRWDRRHEEKKRIIDLAESAIQNDLCISALIPVVFEVRDAVWDMISFDWSAPQSFGWFCNSLLDAYVQSFVPGFDCNRLYVARDSYTLRTTVRLHEIGKAVTEPAVIHAFLKLPADQVIPHLQKTCPDSPFLADFKAFCYAYGKTPPDWNNRPAFWHTRISHSTLIQAIKSAWQGQMRDAQQENDKAWEESQQYLEQLRQQIKEKDPTFVQRFERMVDWAQHWSQALNDRHEVRAPWLWEKELIWFLGKKLQAEGLLDKPEEVLLLTRKDLERIAAGNCPRNFRDLFEERRRTWRRNLRLSPPERLKGRQPEIKKDNIISTPPYHETVELTPVTDLQGYGLTGHTARGYIRKVTDISDAELLRSLSNDTILLLPRSQAFPYADWHSIVLQVAGILSIGQPSHHLMQVARECGVTIVGHINCDFNRLDDGDIIEMDGQTGDICVLQHMRPHEPNTA